MSTRWACPNGCTVVLGPTRPRHDHVCRFCLECSAKSANSRLVRRVAITLETRRALKKTRASDARAQQVAELERVEADARLASAGISPRAAIVARLQRESEKAVVDPDTRRAALDYVVTRAESDSAIRGELTLGTFDSNSFALAWELYKATPGARLTKVYEHGAVFSAIIGFARVRAFAFKRRAKPKPFVLSGVLIGWNRIEPPYSGDAHWRLLACERDVISPGCLMLATSVTPL